MFNNPFGFPFFINTGQQGNSNTMDPITQMEKTLELAKKIRDMDKKDEKKEEKKSLFNITEYWMILMMCTSCIQTILILWMVRGK